MSWIFTLRVPIILALLTISMNAFGAGMRVSIEEMADAQFASVAAGLCFIAAVIGLSRIPARRAWPMILFAGSVVILLSVSRLSAPLIDLLRSGPRVGFAILTGLLLREPPDMEFLKTLLQNIAALSSDYFAKLLTGDLGSPAIRETIWDIPVMLFAAWAGWRSTRHDDAFLGLLPAIAMHGVVLDYTNGQTLSLQAALFSFILIIGFQRMRNPSLLRNESAREVIQETYLTIIVFAFILSIAAGPFSAIAPLETARRISERSSLAERLGLTGKDEAKPYKTSALPREHLTGLEPSLSRTVVFTADTGEAVYTGNNREVLETAIPHHYWRWVVYDVYTGRGWDTSAVNQTEYNSGDYVFTMNDPRYKLIQHEFEKKDLTDDRLFWSGSLLAVSAPFESVWREAPQDSGLNGNPMLDSDMLGSQTTYDIYRASSLAPIVSENELRAGSDLYPADIAKKYLSLPASTPGRVRDLAVELTTGFDNPYDKTRAIESYLRTNYPYKLIVPQPPEDMDVADYFLFELKTGYCDYYATSMAVMARAVGIPARIVIGYAGGDYDRDKGVFVVREANAHSWVEVYFTDIGWVEFEPTASMPSRFIPRSFQDDGDEAFSARQYANRAKHGYFPRSNHQFEIFMTLVLSGLTAAGVFLYRGYVRRRNVADIYGGIYRFGKRIYKKPQISETPLQYAENLKSKLPVEKRWIAPAPDELDYMTRLYVREIYGRGRISMDERIQAAKVWRRLFWRLALAGYYLKQRGY